MLTKWIQVVHAHMTYNVVWYVAQLYGLRTFHFLSFIITTQVEKPIMTLLRNLLERIWCLNINSIRFHKRSLFMYLFCFKRGFVYVSLHLVHLSIYSLYLSHTVPVQSLCLSFRALSIAHTPSVYLVSLCIPHTWLASETILIVQTKGKTTSQIY